MGLSCSLKLVLALVLGMVDSCDAQILTGTPGTLRLPWTTEPAVQEYYPNDLNVTKGIYGPDGPWQAIALMTRDDTVENGIVVPVWPAEAEASELISVRIGGGYYPPNSSKSMITFEMNGVYGQLEWGNMDHWAAPYFGAYDHFGTGFYDNVSLMTPDGIDHKVRVSVVDTTRSDHKMASGANYTGRVGSLGLGHLDPAAKSSPKLYAELSKEKSVLQQLQEVGDIESDFWSVHMGSVAMGQPGSAYLGGYDQARALGHVGVWNYVAAPALFMIDVVLGVEEGHSPFNFSASEQRSVWQDAPKNKVSEEFRAAFGASADTVFMAINTLSSGIYLPPGFCEAAATYLPVSWDKQSGYYHWNTTDPNYSRIVNSPAYLGFTFVDRTKTNITVKVPFKLLNLTLEPPLVGEPTPYFPCIPFESTYGFWALGRAFLQAAFVGVSYDQNLIYLAQAPGPDMAQSLIKKVSPNDTTLISDPIDEFAKSWSKRWTVLDYDGPFESDSASADTSNHPSSDTVNAEDNTGLSTGAKAGIAVSVIGAAAALGAALFFFFVWRRPNSKAAHQQLDGTDNDTGDNVAVRWKPVLVNAHEMDLDRTVVEMGVPMSHEMEVKEPLHEAPIYTMAVELPAVVPSPPHTDGRESVVERSELDGRSHLHAQELGQRSPREGGKEGDTH